MSVQSPTASISLFVIQDYDEVYTLWQRCAGVGLSSADSRKSIASYLARNPGMSFIARDGKTIIGSILCGHDGRRGYIHHLAVQESHRRQGIGRCLVNHALAALQEESIQKCHLFIFHENESGIAFWQSAGWTYRYDIQVMSTQINEGN